MKITAIAARLRKVAVDMEEMAARDGDLDFSDELVLPLIANFVSDNGMLEGESRVLRQRASKHSKRHPESWLG